MAFLDYQGLKTFKNCIDDTFLPAKHSNTSPRNYQIEIGEAFVIRTTQHKVSGHKSAYAPSINYEDSEGNNVGQVIHQFLSNGTSAMLLSTRAFDSSGNVRTGTIGVYRDSTSASDATGSTYYLTSPTNFRSAIGISTLSAQSDLASGSPGSLFVQV